MTIRTHKAAVHEKREPKCAWRSGGVNDGNLSVSILARRPAPRSSASSLRLVAALTRGASDSRFTQQELPACRPVFSPRVVRPLVCIPSPSATHSLTPPCARHRSR
jgi:hypothetical protein